MTTPLAPAGRWPTRWRDARFSLRIFQWALPLLLFLTATVYEINEHGLKRTEPFTLSLSAEIVFFGITGPVATVLAIGYVRRLVEADMLVRTQLEALNRELESRVAERTAALEQRNEELARANTELQQLDELKSDFVALVSHELRAPLTVLNGGLELALQQSEALPASARRTLEVMASESQRLTRFVQTILDLSRLEAGKLTLTLGPVATFPLLQRAVETVLIGSNRPVQWAVPRDLPPLWADETYLEEIIRNFVRNADQYSPPGQPIKISAQAADGHIQLYVADHGPGIPPEMQEHLFERFYRGQHGQSAAPGWGLGLYFARKLTEAQAGQITLRSPVYPDTNQPGAEFCLSLPIAEEPEDV
jgi:sigma-B regulation protein RsbU (phosphoserine phosphatase)